MTTAAAITILTTAQLPACPLTEPRYGETREAAVARVMAKWPGFTPDVYELKGRVYITTPKESE